MYRPNTLTETPPTHFAAAATLRAFLDRIAARTAHIGIVGLGYVGLPLTLLFSEDGFRITGFDIDPVKVETLNRGESYIHRIEPEHIRAAQGSGFAATADFSRAAELDAVLICVPTPLHPDHTPDMQYVVQTIEALAGHLHPGQLVILESTTYPGTTEEIIVETIEQHGNRVMRLEKSTVTDLTPERIPLDGVLVAFSPEREDPGNVTTPRRQIPKIVGGVDETASLAACALYGVVFKRTVSMSSPAAAEMTKLLENIYRSVNIALVNELKQLCLLMGIDIWEVIEAASTKPFGFQAFYPGPGVGGHCIPVDPFYLTWKAKQFDFTTRFIELAGEVNEYMPNFVVEVTERELDRAGKSIGEAHILVLGVAYKRNVDDLRESPALSVIKMLRWAGASVKYNDPFFPRVGSGRKYDLNMTSTPVENLAQYDCVLILTDHSVYDYKAICAQAKLVIDTRNTTSGIDSPTVVRC
jgi:UDP-N-acetyl-D-glucosamine dehydrogenase